MASNVELKKQNHPPESRSELQQKYIAGIVYDLISEFGIENVTMRQIAEVAQLSLGTITYHFSNKQNLIATALEVGYALPEDWDEFKGSPAAQLRRITLSYALESPNSRWWRFWINHVAISTRDAELQAHQSKRFDKQRRFWIRLLAAGIEKGEILPDTPIDDTVDKMLVEVHGLVVLQLVKPSAKMRSYARNAIITMIDSIMTSPAV